MMKKLIQNLKSKLMPAVAVCLCIGVSSCVPNDGPAIGGGDNDQDQKPVLKDPEGTKSIDLVMETGTSFNGLYYSTDGSITSGNGWRLASIGYENCFSYVDYIPLNNWSEQLYVTYGDGFIGYHEKRGFVRFYAAGVVINESGRVVGLKLKYMEGFNGKNEDPTVAKNSLEFGEDGGDESVAVTSKTYTVFKTLSNATWCKVKETASVYPYIFDGVKIEVEPNTGSEPREANVTLTTSAGKTTVIKVTQEGHYTVE